MRRRMTETVLMTVIALLCGCEKIDVGPGRSKLECFPDRYGFSTTGRPGGSGDKPSLPEDSSDEVSRDTLVYACGVDFPEDYDWQRDTAYGRVDAEVVLYRNGERVLTIKTGKDVSAAADKHHLIGGHIFTEAVIGDETMIGRDGGRLFTFHGREALRGLAVTGGDVFTLSQRIGGKGFSYRRNGNELMTSEDGKILGDMNSNPLYRTGALYVDEGGLCFSYCSEKDGRKEWFLVKDCIEEPVELPSSTAEVYDIRSIGGSTFVTFQDGRSGNCMLMHDGTGTVLDCGGRYLFRDVCIGPSGSGFLAIGRFGTVTDGWHSGCWGPESGFQQLKNDGFIFGGEGAVSTLDIQPSGMLTVNSPALKVKLDMYRKWYLPSFRIGHLTQDKLYLALTPCDDGKKPFILTEGNKRTELGMNGFLTAVEVCLVPKGQM